jgi:Putative MetA-pathway of phenol degradation
LLRKVNRRRSVSWITRPPYGVPGLACACLVLLGAAATARADSSTGVAQQSLDDAWWTGSLLAPNAATAPHGHMLVEPYVYDEITNSSFDTHGDRHALDGGHQIGSLTYIIYALTDRLAIGLLPRFGYEEPAGAPNSSAPAVGDFGLQLQYGLTRYTPGSWVPATSVVLGETLPTGRYDQLSRESDGLGAGAYTTALALYSQDYLWLANGRIMRVRLDVTYTWSACVGLENVSVYGTGAGFRGRACPGQTFTAIAAAEYSLTRNWVLAADVVYEHSDSTRVAGAEPTSPGGSAFEDLLTATGASESQGVAPAIEYNFTSTVGVIAGVRILESGHNTTGSITPVVAVNMVF